MKRVLTLFTMILMLILAMSPVHASSGDGLFMQPMATMDTPAQAEGLYLDLIQTAALDNTAVGIYLVALTGAQAIMNKPYATMSIKWLRHYAPWAADQRGYRTGVGTI